MPTYEFKCKQCDCTFETQQPIWARHKGARCPQCGSDNTERLVSRFNSTKPGGSCGSGGTGGQFT